MERLRKLRRRREGGHPLRETIGRRIGATRDARHSHRMTWPARALPAGALLGPETRRTAFGGRGRPQSPNDSLAPAAALERWAGSISRAHSIASSRLHVPPPAAAARKSAATPPNQSGWCEPSDRDGGRTSGAPAHSIWRRQLSPTTRIRPWSPSTTIDWRARRRPRSERCGGAEAVSTVNGRGILERLLMETARLEQRGDAAGRRQPSARRNRARASHGRTGCRRRPSPDRRASS